MSKWKPRGSALGYYMACSYRAAFDRAIDEGVIELPPEVTAEIALKKQSSPYADLGTVIHFASQELLGAAFPGPTAEYAPDDDQYENAAGLFGGSRDALMRQVRVAAQLVVDTVNKHAPGMLWDAEPRVIRPWVQGHIDLVSRDRSILIDIKTTSKPPHFATIPPTHMIQTLAYVAALEEQERHEKIQRVIVLYVDSTTASWVCASKYAPRSEGMLEYREIIKARAKALQKKNYLTTATPNVGDACSNYCPYVTICRDRYSAAKGDVERGSLAPKVVIANPFGKKA